MTLHAGVAVVAITPPAGLAMAGFAARSAPATGAHDPLTVRALAVNDTVLVTADVIGLDAALCARVRAGATVPAEGIVIHATHTHGGPATMPGRLGIPVDPAWMQRLEAALGHAIAQALAARQPASLHLAFAADPDVARNRRHADGPVDRALPVLWVRDASEAPLAVVVNYACHPVVLGADNLLWTADYPHFTRAALEAETGAVALFLTGCVGDLNTGHSAAASLTTAATPERSFAAAQLHGARIAACALRAYPSPLAAHATAKETLLTLSFKRRETDAPDALAKRWAEDAAQATDSVRKVLLGYWANWAQTIAQRPLTPLPARVSWLDWGGLRLIGMPGEIFAATALHLRARLRGPAMLMGFCEDNPGYIPPAEEYPHGGYEVDEAHRYYGQPATFAPGAAEALRDAALALDAQES